jgi:hypothetical protein
MPRPKKPGSRPDSILRLRQFRLRDWALPGKDINQRALPARDADKAFNQFIRNSDRVSERVRVRKQVKPSSWIRIEAFTQLLFLALQNGSRASHLLGIVKRTLHGYPRANPRFKEVRAQILQATFRTLRFPLSSYAVSAVELREAGFSPAVIARQGYSVAELLRAGVNPIFMFPLRSPKLTKITYRDLQFESATRFFTMPEVLERMRKWNFPDASTFKFYAVEGNYSGALELMRYSNDPHLQGFDPRYVMGLLKSAHVPRAGAADFFDVARMGSIARLIRGKKGYY